MADNALMPEDSVLKTGNARANNLAIGGQQGHMTDSVNWWSTEDFIKPHVIAVLMAAPGGFEYMPEGKERRKFLKALVEQQAIAIVGINVSLTKETVESVVNNTEFFEQTSRVARERSRPTFSWMEKRGKVVTKMIYDWIVDLDQDPETGKAGIIRYSAYQSAGYPELTPPMKTMSVMFFEPDETMSRVVDAVLGVNMSPQGIPKEMSMTKGAALETLQLDIEFSMHQRVGKPIIDLAQQYLDDLNKTGYAPQESTPFLSEIDGDVSDEALADGYRNLVTQIAANVADAGL